MDSAHGAVSWFAALPKTAFVAVGTGCSAVSLIAVAAAAKVPQDSWRSLAQIEGWNPPALGVHAENYRACAVAFVYLSQSALKAELSKVFKNVPLKRPLRRGDSVWSVGEPPGGCEPLLGLVAQFPEVIENLKKVNVQAYPHAFPWRRFAVHVVSNPASLHAVWQRASAEGARAFDARLDVDCRLWLAPGQHGVKRHVDMVAQGRMSSGSIDVHICPKDFQPKPAMACLRGWYDESSYQHFQTYLTSPGFSLAEAMATFKKHEQVGFLPRTAGRGAQHHLVIAATVLSLRAAGRNLKRIVSTHALHGFGIRASPDLVVETDDGLVSVEFFAQARHNFRNASLGEAPDHFPEKAFQSLICAAKLDCQTALTVFYSYQASILYWQCTPVSPSFRCFAADVAAAWFPDGRLRLELFRGLARHALRKGSVDIHFAQLPKDVCPQPFCLAGVRCRRRRHVYAVRDVQPCDHFFSKGRCKHGDTCRSHHGGDVVSYEADGSELDWVSAGALKSSKKGKQKTVGTSPLAAPPAIAGAAQAVEFLVQFLQPQF